MSAICPIADRERSVVSGRSVDEAGFTLLEILVVMAIAATLVAAVIPAMSRVVGAVTYDGALQSVVAQLDDLGFRVFTSGKPITLSTDDPSGPQLAGLDLPSDWSLVVPRPIHFNSLGMCDGGDVTIRAPDGRATTLRLAEPDCAVVPVGNR